MKTKTLGMLFLERIEKTPNNAAYSYLENQKWVTLSWADIKKRVANISFALRKLGVKRGDRVAFLSGQRIECSISDLAVSAIGAVAVPIYPQTSSIDCHEIIARTASSVLFLEDGYQLKKLTALNKRLQSINKVVLLSRNHYVTHYGTFDKFHSGIIHFNELNALGEKEQISSNESFENIVSQVEGEDLYSIVFTSGVCSRAKAVSITHAMALSRIKEIAYRLKLSARDVVHPTLPQASTLGRVEMILSVYTGWHTYLSCNTDKMIDVKRDIKPTLIFCNTKSLEEAYYNIQNLINKKHAVRRRIMQKIIKLGTFFKIAFPQKLAVSAINKIIYYFIRILFLFGFVRIFGRRLRFTVVDGSEVNPILTEFYSALGVPIVTSYGMAETFSIVSLSEPGKSLTASGGILFKDLACEVRDGGQIYLKGENIFKEYYNDSALTARVFVDGWLKTGDLGSFNGSILKIFGKSETSIRLSEDEYVYPERLEILFSFGRYIDKVFIVGEGRPYLTALITLNREMIIKYARKKGMYFSDFNSLCENEMIHDLISKRIKLTNEKLKSSARVKNFQILRESFSIENDELTPSLKLRRKYCLEKYSKLIEKMYQ